MNGTSRRSRALLLGGALLLVAPPGHSQTDRFTFYADGPGAFGTDVCGGVDWNQDGFPDLAVGDPWDANHGTVRAFSGRDGGILYTLQGGAWGDGFGQALANTGDLDGDGLADLAIGIPNDDDAGTDAGSILVVSGGTGATILSVFGDAAGDRFGFSLADAGDVDADGIADLIVGVPYGESSYGTDAGYAKVLRGSDGSTLSTIMPMGGSAGGHFGWSVDGGADADGDGYLDVVLGGPHAGSGQGYVLVTDSFGGGRIWDLLGGGSEELGYVVRFWGGDVLAGSPGFGNGTGRVQRFDGASGFPLMIYGGQAPGDRFGTDVDTNGAIVVGAPGENNSTGAVRVYDAAGLPLGKVEGSAPWDQAGLAVAGAGDLDGDGSPDYLVGIPGDKTTGYGFAAGAVRAFTLADSSVIRTWSYGFAAEEFGYSVDSGEDLNGDGTADVIVGVPGDKLLGVSTGGVHAYSAADGALIWSVLGDGDQGDRLGHAVSGAGDVDGDATPDVIAGAPYDTTAGSQAGRAQVLSGLDGSLLLDLHPLGPGDIFGWSVSGAGDANTDGFADVIVGALWDDFTGTQTGSARVFSGADGGEIYRFGGVAPDLAWGYAVSGAGDVDGDGVVDLAVGAPYGPTGRVHVHAGATGGLLYSWAGASGDAYGSAVSGGRDVNGDGVPDVIIAAPGNLPARVQVRSGFDGSLLHQVTGTVYELFARDVCLVQDRDYDGLDDFAIGSLYASWSNGYATIFSGADASPILTHTESWTGFGRQIAEGGDLTGDGIDELVVSADGLGNTTGSVWALSFGSLLCQPPVRYGGDLAGSGGLVPQLLMPSSCTNLGSAVSFLVTNCLGGTQGVLVLGLAPASIPALGGDVLVVPAVIAPILLAGTPGSPGGGWLSVPLSIPTGTGFVGLHLYAQALLLDSGAPFGVSMTSGLDIEITP